MILKIFSPKHFAKKLAIFYEILIKKYLNICFNKSAHFFIENWPKMAENIDHYMH
jgi:hypothetical protein